MPVWKDSWFPFYPLERALLGFMSQAIHASSFPAREWKFREVSKSFSMTKLHLYRVPIFRICFSIFTFIFLQLLRRYLTSSMSTYPLLSISCNVTQSEYIIAKGSSTRARCSLVAFWKQSFRYRNISDLSC